MIVSYPGEEEIISRMNDYNIFELGVPHFRVRQTFTSF